MAYTEIVGDLNYLAIYQDIMKASTGQGSAYLHAKETVNAMLADKEMTASEKAVIVSQTISGIASAITTQALGAAIQIAKENREAPYALAKLRADTELTQANKLKIEKDTLVSTATATKIGADVDLARISGWKMQADIYSKNGINVDTMTIATPILSTGILPKNTMGGDYVGAEQAKATVYSTLANAARKDGNVTITRDGNANVISLTPTTPLDECLSGAQTLVAIRQEKAFDDNKLQHAANSSSTMIGMLLSTENSSALNDDDVTLWRGAVSGLSTPASYMSITKSLTMAVVPTSVVKATGITVTGTSTGIVYGANIVIYVVNTVDYSTSIIDVGIVQEDSTWSMSLTPAQLAAVTTGAAGNLVVGLGSVYSSTKAVAAVTIS